MHDTQLLLCLGKHCVNGISQALQIIMTGNENIPNTPFFQVRTDGKPQAVYAPFPQPALTLFFLSGFLPIQRKCSFLFRGRTVAVMGRGQRVNMTKKSKQHTGGFILKKSPEA